MQKIYPGQGGSRWYEKEQKKHDNWPANPYKIYEGEGWVDWLDLLNKKTSSGKEFLSFDSFRLEVQRMYKGEKSVARWYEEEKKKHDNWPAHPEQTYVNKGWVNWFDLVGKKKE